MFRADIILPLQQLHAEIGRVGVAAAGVGLEGIGLNLEGPTAQIPNQGLRVGLPGHGPQESPLSAQNVLGGGKAQRGQLRRPNAAEGGIGGMEGFAHGPVLNELPQPGGLGTGGADGVQQLLGGQTQQPANGHR